MPRLDKLHWQVDSGQNWTDIASAVGITRNALLAMNGEPTTNPTALKVGQVIHVPFG
jgi:hypothetical protein